MSWKTLNIELAPLKYKPEIGDFILSKIVEPIEFGDYYSAGIKICEPYNCKTINYGVYILSDEPYKKGEPIFSYIHNEASYAFSASSGNSTVNKKIIATNDKSLKVIRGYEDISHMPIYSALPKIHANWFEVYVSRLNFDEKITKVNVEYVEKHSYRKSGKFDINGVEIIEGSIINGDGYKSDLNEHYFHCVEYCDGIFGSDIYSDFEALSTYKKIEVIGHISDYPEIVNNYVPEDWSGNLGACLYGSDVSDVLALDSNNCVKLMIPSDSNALPIDAIKNIIGYVDTPIGRRKYPQEVVESVQELKKWIENNKLN
jgi:hypothetical protein